MNYKLKSPLLLAVIALQSALPFTGQTSGGTPIGQGPVSGPVPVDASIKRTYVLLGRARGFVYEPVSPGKKSHVGIFVMHSDADYTNFSTCTEMSKRGYTVLCAANSGGGLDRILTEARSSVAYLRSYPGIQKVVLFGHSGGATLMTAYQEIAENGVKICQGPEKLAKCSDNLAGLPAADGMILADANWGNAEMALFSVDPAVISEESGMEINPDLDLFNPKNGYNLTGSNYSQEFIHKFQSAAGKRENQLIKAALDRVAVIDAGKGRFADDEPFVAPGASSLGPNNKLFAEDVKLMSHTRKPWPLLHGDGSVTTEIVHTVRLPEGRKLTPLLNMGALNTTVRGFLKNSAIRVADDYGFNEDSVHGVDWTSSYASPPGNIQNIHVPLLVMGMTGHWEYLASETIYENSRSHDKSLAFVEGADHQYNTCKPCEKVPGQFGNTVTTLYNYVDKWLGEEERFVNE